jgi:hypothetical protein
VAAVVCGTPEVLCAARAMTLVGGRQACTCRLVGCLHGVFWFFKSEGVPSSLSPPPPTPPLPRRPMLSHQLLGGVRVRDVLVCAGLAVPLAYVYRLVLIPLLANSDLVKAAKQRGILESIGDAAGYLGIDLYGRQPGSITGAFGRQVCTAACAPWPTGWGGWGG